LRTGAAPASRRRGANATVCEDDDLKLAVIDGLRMPDGDERMTQASSIAFGTCWTVLVKPLLDELDKPNVSSEFRDNTCQQLDARRLLAKRRPAPCSKQRQSGR
jgi:hypothetical protein